MVYKSYKIDLVGVWKRYYVVGDKGGNLNGHVTPDIHLTRYYYHPFNTYWIEKNSLLYNIKTILYKGK